jgi:hypothetical protein
LYYKLLVCLFSTPYFSVSVLWVWSNSTWRLPANVCVARIALRAQVVVYLYVMTVAQRQSRRQLLPVRGRHCSCPAAGPAVLVAPGHMRRGCHRWSYPKKYVRVSPAATHFGRPKCPFARPFLSARLFAPSGGSSVPTYFRVCINL